MTINNTATAKLNALREMEAASLTSEVKAQRREARTTFEARLKFKVAGSRISGGIVHVPSFSRRGTFRTVNVQTMRCNCPGEAIARRANHFCIDVVAALNAVAATVLEIVGAPDSDAIADACGYIERGGGMLQTRYLADGGHAPHYGYVPNRVAPLEWSIGLTRQARKRELSRVEVNACLYVLGEMLNQQAVQQAA